MPFVWTWVIYSVWNKEKFEYKIEAKEYTNVENGTLDYFIVGVASERNYIL